MKYKFLGLFLASFILVACNSTQYNSEAGKARLNLALAYLEQNELVKAKQNLDKSLEHDPSNYNTHLALAYYYQKINNFTLADKEYHKALTYSEQAPTVLNNYGTFLCTEKKYTKAYEMFNKALESDKAYYNQGDTLHNIIICALEENNPEEYYQALTKLEKIDPNRAKNLEHQIIASGK